MRAGKGRKNEGRKERKKEEEMVAVEHGVRETYQKKKEVERNRDEWRLDILKAIKCKGNYKGESANRTDE